MNVKPVSYVTNEYKDIGPKRVRLIYGNRVCSMEEVDKYFGDVISEYNRTAAIEQIKNKVLDIKDRLCQIMKRK